MVESMTYLYYVVRTLIKQQKDEDDLSHPYSAIII